MHVLQFCAMQEVIFADIQLQFDITCEFIWQEYNPALSWQDHAEHFSNKIIFGKDVIK